MEPDPRRRVQELFESNQLLFDEVIQKLPASAQLLTRIKLEYESYIRKMQESISNVMAKLQNMVQATEVETLSNFHKRIEELKIKLEKIKADNVRMQQQMEKMKHNRQMIAENYDKKLRDLYLRTHHHLSTSKRKRLNLSIDEATSFSHLHKQLLKVENRFVEAREVTDKKYVSIQRKTRLQNKLKEKEAVQAKIAMDNKTLTIMLKRINTSIAAVESYLPYLQQHHINASSFPLENYIKAIIASQPDLEDGISDEEAEDPTKEMEAEMTLDCYEKFNELFENEKYEEAALYAATSFKGILRTLKTLQLFKTSARRQTGKELPLLCYCEYLLQCAPAYKPISLEESTECASCIIEQGKIEELTAWIAQGSLPVSVELGSLIYKNCSCSKLCNCGCKNLAFIVFESCRATYQAAICLVEQGKHISFLSFASKAHFSKQDYLQMLCFTPRVDFAMILTNPSDPYQQVLTIFEIMQSLFERGNIEEAINCFQTYLEKLGKTFTQVVMDDERTSPDLLQDLLHQLYETGLEEMALDLFSLLKVKSTIHYSILTLKHEFKEPSPPQQPDSIPSSSEAGGESSSECSDHCDVNTSESSDSLVDNNN